MNILKNGIKDEGLQAIEAVFRESQTLKSICGATAGSPELDLSGQDLRASDAKVVAVELKYNGALTSLDISANNLTRGALKAGKEGWEDDAYETDMTGTQSHPAATNY